MSEFNELKMSADQGDAEAQVQIGIMYYDGEGVEKNYEEAFKYIKKSAEQGNGRGQLWLGKLYFEGKGISEVNYEESVKYSRLSADQGVPEAYSNLGIAYKEGLGVPKDLDEAFRLFKICAEMGNDDGQLYLGLMYCNGEAVEQNYEEAIKLFKLSADQGNANAQCNLGILYRDGKGVSQDYSKAIKYFELSAEQGNQIAQLDLGMMYYFGRGVSKNLEQGFKYIKLSAEQGNAIAQLNMGLLYRDGVYVHKNLEEAFKYFKLSADQGNADAQYCLGDMYLEGNGVEKNYEEAFKYFSLSAEKNNALAQKELGMMYWDGKGVSKDLDKAKKYLKLSSDQGNKEAKLTLNTLPYIKLILKLIIFPFAIIILPIIKGLQYILLNVFPYIVKPIDKFHIFFRKEEKTESTPKKKKKKKKDKTKSSEQNISSESEESNELKDNSFQKSKPLLLNEVIRNLLNGCWVDENGCWVNARCALNEYWVSCFVLFFSFLLLELFFYSFGLMIGHGIEYYKINLTEANTELLTVLFITALLAPCLLVFGWTIDLVHRRLNDIGMPIKIQKWLIPIDFFIGLFVPGQVEENEFGKPRKYHIDIKKLFNSLFVKKRKKLSKEKRIAQVMERGLNKKAARVEIFLRDNLLYIIVTFIVGLTTYIYYSNNEQKEIKPVAKKVVTQNNTKPTSEKVSTQNSNISTTTDIDLIKGMIRERNYIEAANRLKVLVGQGNKEVQTFAIKTIFGLGFSLCLGKNIFGENETIEKNIRGGVELIKIANSYNTPEVQKMMKMIYDSAENGDPDAQEIVRVLKYDSLTKEARNDSASPCSLFFKEIEFAVKQYNQIYDEKMSELDYGFLRECQLLNTVNSPSKCIFTSVGDLTKDGYIKCLIHDKNSKNIDEKSYLQKINSTKSKYKVPMEETETFKNLIEKIKSNKDFEDFMFYESIISNANFYKVDIDLKQEDGEEALEVAKIVQEFYTSYLIYKDIIGQYSLTPSLRISLNLLRRQDFDAVFLEGNGGRNRWIIDEVRIKNNTAVVKYDSNYGVICKKINGKWIIDDVENYKNAYLGNLGVVTLQNFHIYSKRNGMRTISSNNLQSRIIRLDKEDDYFYKIDIEMLTEDYREKQIGDYNSDWFIRAIDIIPFNYFNRIKKGEDKYLAYIVLGEPRDDISNKLYYTSNDYISYDNNGKITSWTGFEDLKEFFDDGTGSNNQNIGYITAKSGINLRKEPNTKSEKVCGLSYDTQVMILDYNGPKATFENITSNWYLITDGTKVGWAFGGFIKKN